MTTPIIMINSTITIVTTMMTSMVVAPSLWGILVGCGVVLLTGTVVVSSGVDAVQAKHTTNRDLKVYVHN